MKLFACVLFSLIILGLTCLSIPQNFGGNLFGATFLPKKIANDFTEKLIAASIWDNNKLPGDWKRIPSIDKDEVLIFAFSPIVWGYHPTSIYANYENQRLKSISLMYLDSESFFRQISKKSLSQESSVTIKNLFKKKYREIEESLKKELYKHAKKSPKESFVGKTKYLRNHYLDYKIDKLTVRLAAEADNGISLIIMRNEDLTESYLDPKVSELSTRERRQLLEEKISLTSNGDLNITDVPIFQQGQRPYCAVNTLGMATYHIGLRMSTDALAAGARFRYSNSAKGSKMLDLYRAAAEESGATLQRGRSFDFNRAQKYLEKGYPIIVWRRFSYQRDKIHTAAAKGIKLPDPLSEDQSKWPTSKNDPGHASVITGFNKKSGEVIFMESWGVNSRGKRMSAKELEATSYATFYLKI